MCVYMKICVFLIKYVCFQRKKTKNTADPPTDRACGVRPEVGRSVGGVFVCCFSMKTHIFY